MNVPTRHTGRSDKLVSGEHSGFVLWCLHRYGAQISGTALDIPGGSGRHALLLAALGMTVICADIDFLRLRRFHEAREATNSRGLYCVQMNAQRPLPFAECQFDLVLVVHYYAPGFLVKAVKLLKPAGHLIFETFGAQGANWIGLPKAGAVASELSESCDLVSYREQSVRSRPEHVTVKLFARRLTTIPGCISSNTARKSAPGRHKNRQRRYNFNIRDKE